MPDSIPWMLLGAIFLMAGVPKVFSPSEFAIGISGYRILPPIANSAIGHTLPYLEIAVGTMLIFRIEPHITSSVALIMLISFTVAALQAIYRSINLECSCFGLLYKERIGAKTLVRDSVLIAIGAWLLFNASAAREVTWTNIEVLVPITVISIATGFGVLSKNQVRQSSHPH